MSYHTFSNFQGGRGYYMKSLIFTMFEVVQKDLFSACLVGMALVACDMFTLNL